MPFLDEKSSDAATSLNIKLSPAAQREWESALAASTATLRTEGPGFVFALTTEVVVSIFDNKRAKQASRRLRRSVFGLAKLIADTPVKPEAAAPLWIFSKTNDGERTAGQIRNTYAAVIDIDSGSLGLGDVLRLCRQARVLALVHTTKRHTRTLPRIRVIFPLSQGYPVDRRYQFTAWGNGLLGGIAAPESFTQSQPFFYSAVAKHAPPQVRIVFGNPIDKRPELASGAVGKNGAPGDAPSEHSAIGIAADDEDDLRADRLVARHPEALEPALDRIPNPGANFGFWSEAIGLPLHASTDGSEYGRRLFHRFSARAEDGCYDAALCDAQWDHYTAHPYTRKGAGSLFRLAETHGWRPPWKRASATGFRIYPAGSDEEGETRIPVIKGVAARADLGAIVGAPGAGKSVAGPFMAVVVATGRKFFGRRVRQGTVLYVAAEDATGINPRFKALREVLGPFPDVFIISGAGDLFAEDSDGRDRLAAEIRERQPVLVILDTLAAASEGMLEENDAQAMGRAVAHARELANLGPCVILVHHNAKHDARGLARGHSVLNGALDFSLFLEADASGGRVNIRSTKNRNGPPFEGSFAIRVSTLGVDEDGDPITAAYAEVLDDAAPPQQRLSPSLAAGLRLLRSLAPNEGDRVTRQVWRKACSECTSVSSAKTTEDRERVCRETLTKLIRAGEVLEDVETVWPRVQDDPGSAFDDDAAEGA